MKNIEIVSASAGTGKTHHLSHELPKLVRNGEVAPDRILATTFTNKAADELTARIRTELFRAGRIADAHKLSLSYIGTVDSVCSRFLQDFAFDMGLSPDVQVADEKLAEKILNEAIGETASADELAELEQLTIRLSGQGNPHQGNGLPDWRNHLAKILDRARSNGLSRENLEECGVRSKETLSTACMQDGTIENLSNDLLHAFHESFADLAQGIKKKVESLMNALTNGQTGIWAHWRKAADLTKSTSGNIPIIAEKYLQHPQFRQDMRRQIELVFDLAGRTLDKYQERKKELGMIDFTDQETLVRQLLDDDNISERLHQRFDLILVDEFQDTSPLQLAIFLKLSELAPRSIWVGDQKQAIYGFRDSDPELMNAAVEEVEEDRDRNSGKPHILSESWRSREELVEFTSDLFAPAFNESIGLPEEHVRITVADGIPAEPPGIGHFLETWKIQGSKKDHPPQIACHVLSLLQEDSVNVWHHRDDPEPRTVEPKDIAILCQYNEDCAKTAAALKAVGLPVRLASSGLLRTPEGRLIHAALRLWNDAQDRLAAAEIVRLTRSESQAAEVVEDLLTDSKHIFDHEFVASILTAAKERREAGIALAFNRTLEILPLAELMQRWGDFDQRAANVEAVRSHLENYLNEAEAIGRPQTVTGFMVWLDKLLDTKEGDTGGARSGNAITVSTWHKAKGLEWPIVVLCGWDQQRSHNAFGVHMETENEFDISNPLSGRWIRYWPNPLPAATKSGAIFDAIEEKSQEVTTLERREELRKLYVAMTRARTRLILVRQANELPEALNELLVFDEENSKIRIGENEYNAFFRTADTIEESNTNIAAESPAWYPEPDTRPEYPPAYLQPSAIPASPEAAIGEIYSLGDRIPVNGKPEMSDLGNAIHGFLAADRPTHKPDHRMAVANRLLAGYEVENAISPEDLITISDRLYNWISETWPDAKLHREFPIRHRLENGTLIEGTADLVVEIADGLVIIDHKTFPGTEEQCRDKALEFAGQMEAYAQALELATESTVLEKRIHCTVPGFLVGVH